MVKVIMNVVNVRCQLRLISSFSLEEILQIKILRQMLRYRVKENILGILDVKR